MKALLGTKLGMTQLFDENGNVQRVTIVQAGPCVVTQIKTGERDGYQAVQIGFGKAKNPTKPALGHAKAADASAKTATAPRALREIRLDGATADVELAESGELKVGDRLDVGSFEQGDKITVTGTSKGKGFAGTVKRHNFNTGPKSHGSHNYRQPGSIGSGYPQHVFKGIKMAGRMGGDRVTTKGLKVVFIDQDKHLIAVSGAIPGPRKGLVMIQGVA